MKCLRCNSSNVRKKGVRGEKRRVYCNDCKATTSVDEFPIKTYVITSAQNETPINKRLLASLETFCQHNDAELKVIPFRYKNPTSVFTERQADKWAGALSKYIVDGRVSLNENIQICGEVKIQPTAVNPLAGMQAYGKTKSCIFGSPKVQFETVAATTNRLPKIIATTGCVTEKNYTDSKAGKKAEFDHVFGAVIVTIKNRKRFHIRHISTDKSGKFIDLDKLYSPCGEVKKAPKAEALIMGDLHVGSTCEDVENATLWNDDSIFKTVRPKSVVLHDVMDFYARNHHHRGDFLLAYDKIKGDRDNVMKETTSVFKKLDDIASLLTSVYCIKSNHDEAMDRWVKETDIRKDPKNLRFWCETVIGLIEGYSCPMSYWSSRLSSHHINFVGRSDNLDIKGIDCSHHGDIGLNGAKCTAKGLSQISRKMVVGHSHSPKIYSGVYQVGTSTKLRLEYNKGPSSWLNTHCLIYADGRRTLISVINGEWK